MPDWKPDWMHSRFQNVHQKFRAPLQQFCHDFGQLHELIMNISGLECLMQQFDVLWSTNSEK